MSAVDMLEGAAREEEAERFIDWLSDNGEPFTGEMPEVPGAVADPIYGPVVASNLEYFRTKEGIDPLTAVQAIGMLTTLTYYSSRNYQEDNYRHAHQLPTRPAGWLQSTDFKDSLEAMQRDMTDGKINLLLPEYAMSKDEGTKQVNAANKLLDHAPDTVQRELADANYSLYFSGKTMASGAELHEGTLAEAAESRSEEQMPHLTRTNLAIGQTVEGLAKQVERLTVIDTGSGTGATQAAIEAGINEAYRTGRLQQANRVAIESNPDFYQSLSSFATAAASKSEGSTFLSKDADIDYATVEAGLHLINNDVLETINELTRLPDDLVVVTGNYVWHRLPTSTKEQLVGKVGELAEDSIFLIADLAENGSQVNRRYFNFGNNGPLNCGNLDLEKIFKQGGYEVTRVSKDNAPKSIHPKLVERIDAEADNDGYMWIAHKGQKAAKLLAAA